LDVNICGTEGTLRIIDEDGEIKLYAGNRAARKLKEIKIAKNKQSVWRVEEEFINAVRGTEEVKFTDFTTAVQYMEWTDAVSASLRTGEKVHLPIDAVA
ncbi:MAG: hypothetical protein HOI95_18665, partial [Chromatiales bacterium]|nr:hypothetical protein [Chromatiales bacterium]